MAKIKKSKDPSNPNPNPNPNPNSPPPPTPSTVLRSLFGHPSASSDATASLFSSSNPFRRKPPNPNSPNRVTLAHNSPAKDSKLDYGKHSQPEINGGSGPDSDLEEGKNGGSGPELDLDEGRKRKDKKKKRKRDELEREYELKKYGVVPDDEEVVEKKKGKEKVGKKRKNVDDPAEMMVSQEGYDDESKLLRTVFVGNLPLKIKKKVLIKEFGQFGEVDSVRIRSVPTLDSKKPKMVQVISGKLNEAADSVHAYIVFKTEQAAEASLAHNMSVVGGNHIRVDRACPPRKKLKGDEASTPLYNHKKTVFVGNLPFDVKDEELYQLFCGIKQLESNVEAVRVIRDRGTSLGKGIAYVLFKTREAANYICKNHKLKLRDRELRICHAKSNPQSSTTTPSKRKSPFPENSGPSPSKKFSPGSRSSEGRYKVSTRGDTSYQGLRANKSGEKNRTPSRSGPGGFKPKPKSGEKVKQRTEKRPAVAARKAKAKGLPVKPGAGGGGQKNHVGNKRKMNSRTPQGSNKKKKQRY